MARRRGGSDPDDALELFLDTISNTFGGVLFIAMLVCVMLQVSGFRSGPQADPLAATRLQAQISDLDARGTVAARRLAALQDQLRLNAEASPGAERAQRYAELKQQRDALAEQVTRVVAELEQLRTEVQATRAERDQVVRRQRDLGAEQARLSQQLLELQQQGATARLRVPQARAIDKTPVFLLLSAGRAVFVNRHAGADMLPVGRNADDVNLQQLPGNAGDDSPSLSIRPRPGRGIPIAGRDDVQHLLAPFRNDRHLISIACWTDSFPQCELIRDWLVEQDFNYYLLFLEPGEAVTMTRGQTEGF